MNPSLVVTHCLALWNGHSGRMTQADKDFFDARVARAMDEADDLFLVVLLLITMRMAMELPEQVAEQRARSLTAPYAERWGEPLKATVR